MELSNPNPKNFLYCEKKPLISGGNFPGPRLKHFLYFSKKTFYI